MSKIPPRSRKGTLASLRAICKRLKLKVTVGHA